VTQQSRYILHGYSCKKQFDRESVPKLVWVATLLGPIGVFQICKVENAAKVKAKLGVDNVKVIPDLVAGRKPRRRRILNQIPIVVHEA
jgi:hypothetical protein